MVPSTAEVANASTTSVTSPKKVKPINPFSTPSPTTPPPAAAAAAKVEEVAEVEPVVSVTASNIDSVLNTSSPEGNNVSVLATDDASISVISSIAPPSVISNGGGSAMLSKKGLQRLDKAAVGGGVGNGSRNNLHNSSGRNLTRIASCKSNTSEFRDHSRYQEPPKAVNMSIFRTPLYRQRHPNRNQFDPKNTCWFPTKVDNKYNERFQYPSDLRIADKINSVFYNNVNPR